MKKVLKSRVFAFILGALIFSSISVYAAHKYAASQVTYKNTTLDQALNTLYTTQNTTVTNLQNQVSSLTSANAALTNEKTALQSQVNAKDATISSLQSQLNSLTTAASNFHFTSSTSKQTFNLGFKPDYISCITYAENNRYIMMIYNKKYDADEIFRITSHIDSDTLVGSATLTSNTKQPLQNWFTINNNGLTWNINADSWAGFEIYCTASK